MDDSDRIRTEVMMPMELKLKLLVEAKRRRMNLGDYLLELIVVASKQVEASK